MKSSRANKSLKFSLKFVKVSKLTMEKMFMLFARKQFDVQYLILRVKKCFESLDGGFKKENMGRGAGAIIRPP